MMNESAILQKLKSKSKNKGLPFQLILRLFCQEEFLRRLSFSSYKDKLILKGGLFLFSYSGYESRPTMDIDFLARNLSNNRDEMKKVIELIISEESVNIFVDFEVKSVEDIAEMKAYHGVRLKLIATIANTKTPFDIDIGIGDVVVPDVKSITVPTQLEGFNPPVLASYSLESTIAEKLEAMFARMETSSRMKDYYDIFFLASNYDFNGEILREAIQKTFKQRNTVCDLISLKRIEGMWENSNMQKRWDAFTKKSLGRGLEYRDIIKVIVEFVEGPITSIENEQGYKQQWLSSDLSWYGEPYT